MKRSVSPAQLSDIIEECCEEEGILLPSSYEELFNEHLAEIKPIKSFSGIKSVCDRVRKMVKSSADLDWDYGDIVSIISTPVRFKVAQILDFEGYLSFDSDSHSSRTFLQSFLQSLDDGEGWNIDKLKKWSFNGETGAQFYYRLRMISGWNNETLKAILGDDADELLERNPCETKFRPSVLNTFPVARKYLVAFLQSLNDEEEWNTDTLRCWRGDRGVNGNALYYWLLNNLKRDVSIASLKKFLGEKNAHLMDSRLYVAYEKKLSGKRDVKRYLGEYLAQLKDGERWRITGLEGWVAEDGFRGKNIRFYLASRLGWKFREEHIREILGEDADVVLQRNPFYVESKDVYSLENVRTLLLEFFNGLERGESWSLRDLREWESEEGVSGDKPYRWITRNVRNFISKKTIIKILGDDGRKLLRRNPFYKKVDEIRHIEFYLSEFLDSLDEGEEWSIQKLQQWKVDDGFSGQAIYNWLRQNVRNDGKIDWIYVLTQIISSKYLSRNPFKYRKGQYFSSSQRFETSQQDIDDMNLGRGIEDVNISSPEDILLDNEEAERIEGQMTSLYLAMGLLDKEEKNIVMAFLDGEEIDQSVFLSIVEKLKIRIKK